LYHAVTGAQLQAVVTDQLSVVLAWLEFLNTLKLKETTFQLGDAKSETKKDAALKMLEEAAQKLIHIQKRPLRP
jgi:hypothetical protein